MNYFYSKTTNAFYSLSLQQSYQQSGTWPDDAIPVTDELFTEYSGVPPAGKKRIAGDTGPIWDDIPAPTREELLADAEAMKARLLVEAGTSIAPYQDAVELGIATGQEKSLYEQLKKYRVSLNRVEISTAPDIVWPSPPVLLTS